MPNETCNGQLSLVNDSMACRTNKEDCINWNIKISTQSSLKYHGLFCINIWIVAKNIHIGVQDAHRGAEEQMFYKWFDIMTCHWDGRRR